MTISEAARFLEGAFEVLNKVYFDGELSKCIITIQSDPKAYGRYTKYDAWNNKGKGYREINLGAETLARPMANTIATLIHEMVHMYCDMNNIQDVSRGGRYHNKRFKEEAEKRDLVITYDATIGHSITEPSKSLRSFVAHQHWNGKLTIFRQGSFGGNDPKPKAPSSTRKYVCPCCGLSIRATKDVDLICADCQEHLEKAS